MYIILFKKLSEYFDIGENMTTHNMQKIIINVVFYILFFLCGSVFAQRELVITGEDYPPFEFLNNGEVVGVDVDVVKYIFAKMGIPIKIELKPWKRAWYEVESGKVDACLSVSRKEIRKPFVWYSKEDMWLSEVVFHTLKTKKIKNFNGYETAKNEGLRIGVTNGNSYHKNFWQAFPYKDKTKKFQPYKSIKLLNEQLHPVKDLKTNVIKLVHNRIDVFIVDKMVGTYTAKLMGYGDQITYYEKPLYTKAYQLVFVKNSDYPNLKDIAVDFEKELMLMKKSGEYQKILDKWLE